MLLLNPPDSVISMCPPPCLPAKAARSAKVEVMYTVIQSLTRDGRDRSLDYKISGFHVPPGSWDGQVSRYEPSTEPY